MASVDTKQNNFMLPGPRNLSREGFQTSKPAGLFSPTSFPSAAGGKTPGYFPPPKGMKPKALKPIATYHN